jgi:hypothetical protein
LEVAQMQCWYCGKPAVISAGGFEAQMVNSATWSDITYYFCQKHYLSQITCENKGCTNPAEVVSKMFGYCKPCFNQREKEKKKRMKEEKAVKKVVEKSVVRSKISERIRSELL